MKSIKINHNFTTVELPQDITSRIQAETAKQLFAEAKRHFDRAKEKTAEVEKELEIARAIIKKIPVVTKTEDKVFLVDLDGTVYRFDLGADYTAPGYFRNRPVQKGVIEVVNNLHKFGYTVKIISAAINTEAALDKAAQVKEVFPYLRQEDIIIVPYGMNKMDFVPKGRKYVLIDDFTPNLRAAAEAGVEPCKVFNGINGTKGTYVKDFPYGLSFSVEDNPDEVMFCLI